MGEGAVADRNQERRTHIVAIDGSPAFLNIVRELFQDEGYHVTTTNYVPTSLSSAPTSRPSSIGAPSLARSPRSCSGARRSPAIPSRLLPCPGFCPSGCFLSPAPRRSERSGGRLAPANDHHPGGRRDRDRLARHHHDRLDALPDHHDVSRRGHTVNLGVTPWLRGGQTVLSCGAGVCFIDNSLLCPIMHPPQTVTHPARCCS